MTENHLKASQSSSKLLQWGRMTILRRVFIAGGATEGIASEIVVVIAVKSSVFRL